MSEDARGSRQADPRETAASILAVARLLDRQGRTEEAIAAYERLLSGWPKLPNAWYNLALLQKKDRRFIAALESYRQALQCGIARPEEVHLNCSVIYADHLLQHDAAERELATALELNPDYVPALLNLANLQEDRGRRGPAEELYLRALAVEPNCSLALARYANLRRVSGADDPLIGRLRRAVEAPSISAAERADLGFALGRALDSVGDYSNAFNAYAAANRHSRASSSNAVRYDRAAFERVIDRVIAAFPERTSEGAPRSRDAPQPIFICGMFRSGSTLAEQILAGHSRVTPGGELDLLPSAVRSTLSPFPESMASVSAAALSEMASEYRQTLRRLFPGADLVTDKRPDNFLYIGVIKRLFADAKIVHTTRDALDNCLSVFFLHLDHSMSYALDLLDTGHYYRQYRRLMDHWKRIYGDDIIDVHYDALVRDTRPVVAALLESLGLDWQDSCLTIPAMGRSIKTASVWQVREPLNLRSSGRARNYAKELAPLERYLRA
jgi:tetratricopeptide (TPR) repeat protein